MSYIEVKKHSYRKYRILSKYLVACERFSKKYKNFIYIDTHGGSGKVLDVERDELDEGSVLRAARVEPSFPCHVCEIDPDRYQTLKNSTRDLPNVTCYHGDCNELIDGILDQITPWQQFILCFVDPDGLAYRKGDFCCRELSWRTVEKIARFARTEILLNLPILAISRDAGYVKKFPDRSAAIAMEEHITEFYGSDRWKQLAPGDYRALLDVYLEERLKGHYPYRGAMLVRTETNSPVYYLVYGSKYHVGPKIMRSIMKAEWGYEPILPLDVTHPMSRFIFDDFG